MRYRYGLDLIKPYVDYLATPSGINILRDSPFDHKHHHGLMFAVAVDGTNFWEEREPFGREVGKGTPTVIGGNDKPRKNKKRASQALGGFKQDIEWIGPMDTKPLLLENRMVMVERVRDNKATLLTWQTELRLPPGKKSGTLSGNPYFGLGMRFVESMDKDGVFLYSGDAPGEIVRGDERLTPGPWCAYTGVAEGRRVTVAMFDHPDNPRYPALWFTMQTPFAYLSATRNLWKEPMPLKPGEPVHFRHAIAVWDGEKDAAIVAAMNDRLLAMWR